MVPKGRCHLCGEDKGLTYEHVPARSSFNDASVEMFGFKSWIEQSPDGQMTGGEVKERGAGAHTLCYRCNTEITGDHYVAELKRWTAIAMTVARKLTGDEQGNAVELIIQGAHSARLLKQIVAMLASVNSVSLLDHHRPLRDYAMNPQAVGLPNRYQFYLFVTHPTSSIARYGGLTVRLARGTWCGTWLTDLVWPPCGYVMTIDEPTLFLPIGNISHFANYDYGEQANVTIQLPILVGDQPFPGEFNDPIAGGAFSKPRNEFPTRTSARTAVRVRLADGYTTEDAELVLPSAHENWTGSDVQELLEGMLRTICVLRGEHYVVSIRWSEQGVALKASSGEREIESEVMRLPLTAVGGFMGHEEVPPRGEGQYEAVVQFKETDDGGPAGAA